MPMHRAPRRRLPRGLGALLAGVVLISVAVGAPHLGSAATGHDRRGETARAQYNSAGVAGASAHPSEPSATGGSSHPTATVPSPVAAHVATTEARRVLRRHTGSVRGDGSTVYVANRTAFRPGAARVALPPPVRMRSWAVVDLDTGRILGAHRPRAHLPQASTLKLLTAVTAMRTVPADRLHRVTRFEHRQVCSCAGLRTGARYRRDTLLAGMLLPSGNDAAEALAGSHPGGRAAFYRAMNETARELGATDTVAKNASGLTAAGSHSSARDLVLLLRAALADQRVAATLGSRSAVVATTSGRDRHRVWRATDYVNKYPGSLGKSGFTTPAGNTLVVVTSIRGHRIATATLGAPSGASTKGTRRLTVWAADNFTHLGQIGRLPNP